MPTDIRISDDWAGVAGFLPEDLEEIASRTGALRRRRAIRSAADLVRLSLAYALDDASLRETSAWARERGIARLSDVAVLKRLRGAVPLLREVCSRLAPTSAEPLDGYRLLLEDATTICRRRAKGTDFRVHVAYSPSRRAFVGMELTRADGGERLDRLPCGEGDVLVGDMGYQARAGIAKVRERGAHVVQRFYPGSLPLEDEAGARLSPFEALARLRVGDVLDLPVRTVAKGGAAAVAGRFVAVRKPDDKVQERLARKRKETGKEPGEESKRAERYVALFTTLPPGVAPRDVLEIYRIRWQVETAFKRVKGVISLGETLARDMELCECKILGKLLTLLLIQAYESAFFPWGYPLPRN